MLTKMVSLSFYALLPSTSETRLWCGIEQRGFLTLPDILVYLASITFAIIILLLKRNVIVDFILSIQCSRATSYSAYCHQVDLLIRLVATFFTDKLIGYALSFCPQNMSAYDSQKSGVRSLTNPLNT